ncbi:HD-GYP domain-containing protein [Candidatus Latescibacterota bacterium]
MALKKIDIRKLEVGMHIVDPIYVKVNNNSVLLMPDNTLIVSEGQIRRLIDAEVKTLTIDTDKGTDTFQSLLGQKKWDDVAQLAGDRDATNLLLNRHKTSFIDSFTSIVTTSVTSRILIGDNRVTRILKEILQKIQDNTDVLMAMIRLRSVNEYTYAHSVNVTVMGVAIAIKLGFNDTDIIRFGTGALLADLGMTSFSSNILRRPSGLSKTEKEEIKKHPFHSVEFLKKNEIEDSLIETIIIQHHERFDGTGYPKGLKGNEIHSISKLFSIIDVYLAMTSQRPQRAGIPPHLVLAEILKNSGTLYDPKMSNYFIKFNSVFPAGNMVELTTERLAIVASQNKEDPLRPVVILFTTKKKISVSTKLKDDGPKYTIARGQWELVDLANEGAHFGKIMRGIDHRLYRINPINYLDQI